MYKETHIKTINFLRISQEVLHFISSSNLDSETSVFNLTYLNGRFFLQQNFPKGSHSICCPGLLKDKSECITRWETNLNSIITETTVCAIKKDHRVGG